jgi:hypothetical protein
MTSEVNVCFRVHTATSLTSYLSALPLIRPDLYNHSIRKWSQHWTRDATNLEKPSTIANTHTPATRQIQRLEHLTCIDDVEQAVTCKIADRTVKKT